MKNEKFNSFLKLTATDEADLGIYEDALDFCFDNDDILNIALSGAYGSGKSSIIETYKKKNIDKSLLHISLSNFEKQNMNEDNINRNLEAKIINQLIHQIDAKKIPQTRFKIKKDISKIRLFTDTALAALFTILLIINLRYEDYSHLIKNTNFLSSRTVNILISNSFQLLSFSLMIVIAFNAIYIIIRLQRNQSLIKKAAAKGFEIEILGDEKNSYFDKYLNEVLYLFQKSGSHAIVFEDIDRFNDTSVFEKLKEINTLVNNKPGKKTARIKALLKTLAKNNEEPTTIKFIYLLRDDMFVSKDRTKFFDIIIPVIPIIDSSNSNEKFIAQFEKANMLENFDIKFLKEISMYVDDYRLLKNIYNEYIIYHNLLNNIELDCNKILSMIIYKNIFPHDFSLLQQDKGYVKYILQKLDEIKCDKRDELEAEINLYKESIENDEVELTYSTNELEAMYTLLPNDLTIYNKIESDFSSRLEFFEELKYSPEDIRSGYYSGTKKFNNALSKTHEHPDFIKKMKSTKEAVDSRILTKKKKIQSLQKEIKSLKRTKLRNLITRENKDQIFSIPNDFKEDENNHFQLVVQRDNFLLIKFLITNGYIDEETYTDYISHFYEDTITTVDKIFIRGLTDQVARDFSYNLKSPEKIILFLREEHFRQFEILNFDLLSFLIANKHKYSLMFDYYISYLVDNKPIDFIIGFLETYRYINTFSNYVFTENSEVLDNIIASNYNFETKKLAIVSALCFTKITILTKKIRQFISENTYFLNFIPITIIENYIEVDKEDKTQKGRYTTQENVYEEPIHLANRYAEVGVKFQLMDITYKKSTLYKEIYERNCYILSTENIEIILKEMYQNIPVEKIWVKNYTLISSDTKQPLYDYVLQNINKYIEIVLENSVSEIHDTEKSIISILNNTDIIEENKLKYSKRLKTKINALESITDKDIWPYLLINNCIINNANNFLEYYFYGGGLDDYLISFINSRISQYDVLTSTNDIYGTESTSKLFDSIIIADKLKNTEYRQLLSRYNNPYKKFVHKNIPKDKIDILIDLNIIYMSKDNLLFMREIYPNNLYHFIIQNSEQYFEIVDEDNFNEEELLYLLPNNDIDDDKKIILLEYMNSKIRYDASYSNIIKGYIIKNNFDDKDISALINSYLDETADLQVIIRSCIIKKIHQIIDNEYKLPYELLKSIITTGNLDDEELITLLTISINLFTADEVKNCFIEMNSPLKEIFNGKQVVVERNKTNDRLLSRLQNRLLISSFGINQHDSNTYRTFSKRSKSKQ